MQDKNSSGDRVSASDALTAAIGSARRNEEGLRAVGTYHAVLRGAKEGCRKEYEALLKRIGRVERVGDVVHKVAPRLGRPLLNMLNRQLWRFRDATESLTEVKWEQSFPNLVTDAGAKLMLDTILAGSAFTATTYVGLKGTGTAAVGDTQASHAGWSEVGGTNAPAYSGARKTFSWSAASGTGAGSRTKASSGTFTYTFTSGGTVAGCFLNINGSATVDNTTGTLFSAGDFSGGSKTVASTDTLTVTYSLAV